jgi:hypothetical protein
VSTVMSDAPLTMLRWRWPRRYWSIPSVARPMAGNLRPAG